MTIILSHKGTEITKKTKLRKKQKIIAFPFVVNSANPFIS